MKWNCLLFVLASACWCGISRGASHNSEQSIASYERGGQRVADSSEVEVAVPSGLKLILCLGQSNMAGRGKMTEADRAVVPHAYKLNASNRWVQACSPYHFDKTVAGVGPVDEFVRRYLKDHPGESVGVVPCAVGGSSVTTWKVFRNGKKGKNLETALARAAAAATNGSYVAILWHQGETDAEKWSAARFRKEYVADVESVAQAVRKVTGEDVPFLAGEIGRWLRKDGDHAERVNPFTNLIPTKVPHSAVVSSEGLANQDPHHFTRESQLELGARYYAAWKDLAERPREPFVARWKGNRAAAVSFTFDDGLRDQYELAFPKFKELGLKGTFFLNGGSIDTQTPTRQGALRMTWAMVQEMSDAGMKMSNHGLNHLNHGRSPREAVEVDVASNDVLIATHTGKKPITFAYPNNARNREWSAAVVDPGRVGARTRQTSFGGKHTVESGRKLFQKAKADGAWLVLMTHAVRFGYDQWRDPAFFYTLLEEAAKDDELWIGTFAEVSIYERLREETRIEVEKRGGVGEWKVKVTPPKLDRELFKGKLDLVLPDGRIHSFDPFAGDFEGKCS